MSIGERYVAFVRCLKEYNAVKINKVVANICLTISLHLNDSERAHLQKETLTCIRTMP